MEIPYVMFYCMEFCSKVVKVYLRSHTPKENQIGGGLRWPETPSQQLFKLHPPLITPEIMHTYT